MEKNVANLYKLNESVFAVIGGASKKLNLERNIEYFLKEAR
jgi:hypothetical protein